MLASTTVTNTWQCDGLNCTTPQATASVSPYLKVAVTNPGTPQNPGVSVDLCDACAGLLTPQIIVDYIASLNAMP